MTGQEKSGYWRYSNARDPSLNPADYWLHGDKLVK